MEDYLISLITTLAGKYPIILTVVAAIGTLRVLLKPLMSMAKVYAASTENKTDDKIVESIEKSKIYTGLIYVLDWVTSVKWPKKDK